MKRVPYAQVELTITMLIYFSLSIPIKLNSCEIYLSLCQSQMHPAFSCEIWIKNEVLRTKTKLKIFWACIFMSVLHAQVSVQWENSITKTIRFPRGRYTWIKTWQSPARGCCMWKSIIYIKWIGRQNIKLEKFWKSKTWNILWKKNINLEIQ